MGVEGYNLVCPTQGGHGLRLECAEAREVAESEVGATRWKVPLAVRHGMPSVAVPAAAPAGAAPAVLLPPAGVADAAMAGVHAICCHLSQLTVACV